MISQYTFVKEKYARRERFRDPIPVPGYHVTARPPPLSSRIYYRRLPSSDEELVGYYTYINTNDHVKRQKKKNRLSAASTPTTLYV